MANKTSIDEQLNLLAQRSQTQGSLSQQMTGEIQALHHKAVKSVDKQDAMRLLMLQYCAGLQSHLTVHSNTELDGQTLTDDASHETQGEEDRGDELAQSKEKQPINIGRVQGSQNSSFRFIRKGTNDTAVSRAEEEDKKVKEGDKERSSRLTQKLKSVVSDSKDQQRSSSMGGFVRRASSSVREKVSMLKDFSRRSRGQSDKDESLKIQSNKLNDSTDSWSRDVLSVNETEAHKRSARSNSDGAVGGIATLSEVDGESSTGLDELEETLRRSSEGDRTLTQVELEALERSSKYFNSVDLALGSNLIQKDNTSCQSEVEILIQGVDGKSYPAVQSDDLWPHSELSRAARSFSDSGLDLIKKCSLTSDVCHTGSLPKNLPSFEPGDDSDNSDFLIIESSDEAGDEGTSWD